jgi:hypothetical protein
MPVHPGDLVGNDGGGPARAQERSEMVDLIGLVAGAARRGRGDERGRALNVGVLAAGQEDGCARPSPSTSVPTVVAIVFSASHCRARGTQHAVQVTRARAHPGRSRATFFKRTPGPPPFSEMNSTPAASRTVCRLIAFLLRIIPPRSKALSETALIPASFAKSFWDQSRSARAARH